MVTTIETANATVGVIGATEIEANAIVGIEDLGILTIFAVISCPLRTMSPSTPLLRKLKQVL